MKIAELEPLPTRRRLVLLVGNGEGPKIAFRNKSACIRVCGLNNGDKLQVEIGSSLHEFDSDGDFGVPGGEFAMARVIGDSRVTCELYY